MPKAEVTPNDDGCPKDEPDEPGDDACPNRPPAPEVALLTSAAKLPVVPKAFVDTDDEVGEGEVDCPNAADVPLLLLVNALALVPNGLVGAGILDWPNPA